MYMELNTIIELVKAGFTKDEIMQMEQTAVQPATHHVDPELVQMEMVLPVPDDEPAPAQVNEPAPAPTPAPVQEVQQEQPSMADLMQSIAKLTSAVQANAIAQSVIPQGYQKAPTAEDMLAEIIRPTYKERS